MIQTHPDLEQWLNKLVAFCVVQRRPNGPFWNWTEKEIRRTLHIHALTFQLFTCTNEYGNLTGVAQLTVDHTNKNVHVENILCIPNDGSFRALFGVYEANFRGYTLTAVRRGKKVKYNTQRFLKHLFPNVKTP